MAKFEYNWATAEMAKLYLRNSRAQAKRKARKAAALATPDPPINPGSTSVDGADAGQSGAATGQEGSANSSDDSDPESDNN